MMTNPNLPRGLRNCNPGNLRRSKDRWKGLRAVQTDPDFFQFTEMRWGYRALMRTLRNYRRRHGCQTVADYIRRWAPPQENDTAAYVRSVCRTMQVPQEYVPDTDDQATLVCMAAAISRVENGVEPDYGEIMEGFALL